MCENECGYLSMCVCWGEIWSYEYCACVHVTQAVMHMMMRTACLMLSVGGIDVYGAHVGMSV